MNNRSPEKPSLETLLSLIEKTFPVPARFRSRLAGDTAELSRLLTGARGEREGAYLNRPGLLSAYLRYFLPWNVFRLQKLFDALGEPDGPGGSSLSGPAFCGLADGDALTDLGSGPLSFPIALWLARPELRKLRLEFRCVDKSAPALEAGKRLFAALCAAAGGTGGGESPGASSLWKIKTIHDSLDAPVRGAKAALVSAVNVFNEVSGPAGKNRNAAFGPVKAAALLESLLTPGGQILAVEPGNPQGGAFIASLRAALLDRGIIPAAPCPHAGPCPMPGAAFSGARRGAGKNNKPKWCHFAFDTEEAPAALHRLSTAAGIPKERAVFSFVLAGPPLHKTPDPVKQSAAANPETIRVRIVSDPFPVEGGSGGEWGRYGCSDRGLVLVRGRRLYKGPSGLREEAGAASSLSLLELPFPAKGPRDPKTGFPVIPYT